MLGGHGYVNLYGFLCCIRTLDIHSYVQGLVTVSSLGEDDIAIPRLKSLYELRLGGFEALFHAESLKFDEVTKMQHFQIIRNVCIIIVDIYPGRLSVISIAKPQTPFW